MAFKINASYLQDTTLAAQGTKPEREAQALSLARQLDIPQPAVEQNLDQAQQSAQLQGNLKTLDGSPELSAFVANNPLAARIAQDDFNKLGVIEQLTTALKTGASSALLSNQLGRAGNVKQAADLAGQQMPQTDREIQTLQGKLAATPKLNGAIGTVQNATGFLTGLVDNAISGLPEAVGGGALGLSAGGVGAVPGALVGEAIGFNADMARVAAGNAYLKLNEMRGSDGQPVSEAGKQFGAIFTGVATYMIGKYASGVESKLLGQTAESLSQEAITRAVQTPTFTAAVARMAANTAKGAAQGAGVMTAMEASSIMGEEIAKAVSDGHFNSDPAEIIERLKDSAINGAILLGAMHGTMHGLGLYGDFRAAQNAEAQTQVFKNLLDGASESKLRDRSLQDFQELMQQQTDGTPVENLYVPAERIRELYQGARLDPQALTDRTQDPLFGFVQDMPKQLAEAAGTGGDVVIPTADFVSHLAGSDVANHLLPDIRVGSDAMSINEAKQFQSEYAERIKQATDEASKADLSDSVQRITDQVRQQAIAAGYSDTLASKYAAIYAARYATRGERLGIDPFDAYQQSGITIQKGEADQAAVAPREFAQAQRGKIGFSDGKALISIFANKDSSTLIHESGHAWLEELMQDANRPDAPAQLKDDMRTVSDWLGHEGESISTEQHEQFARAAEAYFMEGKAPSAKLARVFSRFKQWLTRIYQTVSGLDTPINNDIRGVFDRLLATDAEIDEARKTTGLEPNFRDRQQAGMTSAEWSAYTKAIDKANQQAESTMLDKMMSKVRRQRTAEYKAERTKAVDEAATEVDKRPDIQALTLLTKGKMPDGSEMAIKLSKADIEATYGKKGATDLPKGVTSKDGVHPDAVAEILGFDSGDELVKSLQSLEQQQREIRLQEGEKRGIRQYLIDQAADQKMEPHTHDLLDEGSIRDEAVAAVHSEQQAQLLAQELRYLRRSAARELEARGKGRKDVEQAKTQADWDAAEADLLSQIDKAKDQAKVDALKQKLADLRMTIRWNEAEANTEQANLRESVNVTRVMLDGIRKHVDTILANKTTAEVGRFNLYLRDERKAAADVQRAILKKDWAEAAAAKQRQMLSHILYTKAKDAAGEVDRAEAKFKRLTDKPSFKGVDQQYTDQIHDLLARFGFDSGRGEELARGKAKTLEAFVNDKAAEEGIELAVDPALYTMAGKPLDAMTMTEFRALNEAVDSMHEIGRGQKMILVDGQMRDFDEVKAEIVAAIRALGERMKSDFYDPADAGKLAAAKESMFTMGRSVDASLTKPEALFDQIDKGDPFGIMNQAVFRRLKEGQANEDRWQDAARQAFTAAVKASGKDWSKHLNDTVPSEPGLVNPETGRPMKLTRKRMLAMALNWGNDGNRVKLAEGYGWSPKVIQSFLMRNMTKADWDFVQSVWRMFDAHKQDLDELQRRVTGVGLDMVKADAFDTPHGRYEGGYYPIVYDAKKSFNAETHAERSVDAMFPNNYTRATTPKGSTISRVEGVKRPIELSLDIAPWKIGQVIHDLAFREAVMAADRLLSSDSVKKAMDDVLGPEYRKTMRPWLQHIANSRNINDAAMNWVDKAISQARMATVMVGIGFRLSTMFKHGFSAMSNSFKELGPEWMIKGVREFYAPGQIKANWDFITSKSAEMKYRMNAYDKDVATRYANLLNDNALTRFQKQAQHLGHLGVSYLDLGSAAPTWLGAYRKAMSEGKSDSDAVFIADKTVRNAHGAQGITDTAAIQRAHGAYNLINMFYGFFNHVYNRQRTMFMQGAEGLRNVKAGEYRAASKNFSDVLATSFWYVAVPALVEAMATTGGPNQDKDEGWGEWAGKAIAAEIPAGIPILRDIAKAAIEGRDYEISPIAKTVNDVLKAGHDISSYVQGNDPDESFAKHITTAAGYLTGLPTAAPFTAGKFLWDVNDGDADPESVRDWYSGITRGKVDHH